MRITLEFDLDPVCAGSPDHAGEILRLLAFGPAGQAGPPEALPRADGWDDDPAYPERRHLVALLGDDAFNAAAVAGVGSRVHRATGIRMMWAHDGGDCWMLFETPGFSILNRDAQRLGHWRDELYDDDRNDPFCFSILNRDAQRLGHWRDELYDDDRNDPFYAPDPRPTT